MENFGHYGNQKQTTSARPTGHNGLKNQGATCYLNSVLQCLYMTVDFREEVENFKPDPQNSHNESTNLMLELQKLFKQMNEITGTTEGITQSLYISNVNEQQDAVEYYQKILKAIRPKVSKVFEGKMSNKTKCLNNHIFEEESHFFTIPLDIEDGHSEVFNVEKGLEAFFKSTTLDEDNWLYCKHCGQKTETETWKTIEEFPTILTLYPKRFYFDYNQMRPVKNHCRMSIPLQLLIFKIKYELYAVINHYGEESGGHYNAVIKSFENDEWYCFDDTSVTMGSLKSFQNSRLAYLLMYRKVDGPHLDEKTTYELQLQCQVYCNLVNTQLQWLRNYISVFKDCKVPTSYKETETLCHQFLEFKKVELPRYETNRNHAKRIYKSVKSAVQAGQIEIPPGYSFNNVNKEWKELHEAIIERERLLSHNFERVYHFHDQLINQHSECNLHEMCSIPFQHPEKEEVLLRYIQDLLDWVEKNQKHIHNSEWGADLPSIDFHLGSHQKMHQSIQAFKCNIDNAQADENQLTPTYKQAYRDYLAKLDNKYNELWNFSLNKLCNLIRLHTFAEAATKELMWLSERKEEELNYDWSDNNTNMTAKKDNYLGLMQDLEHREKTVNSVQATGGELLKEDHPAWTTIKALSAALQTELNWLMQLRSCIAAHLEVNTAYFQFFADVKEAEEKIKKIHETMKEKYNYDRSTTVTHLEHLLHYAEDEMKQHSVLQTHLDSLNCKAKNIVQLKPRNPANPVKDKLFIQAVCNCSQREITLYKGDKYVLLNNSQPFKWEVESFNGIKATVPSICFIISPTNKEAIESSSGLVASWQEHMNHFQKLHVDIKSLLSWQYLMRDIQCINSLTSIMTPFVESLKNIKQHSHIFMSNSQDSLFFDANEHKQAERAYNNATQLYSNLLQLMDQEGPSSSKSLSNEAVTGVDIIGWKSPTAVGTTGGDESSGHLEGDTVEETREKNGVAVASTLTVRPHKTPKNIGEGPSVLALQKEVLLLEKKKLEHQIEHILPIKKHNLHMQNILLQHEMSKLSKEPITLTVTSLEK